MSYLIFCSYEIGGLPFQLAQILNRRGIKTYYISLAVNATGHDSVHFHLGKQQVDWDLSGLFRPEFSFSKIVRRLKELRDRYGFKGCLATGHKSFCLDRAGIAYHYWSYGSDLDQVCFGFAPPPHYPAWKKVFKYPWFHCTERQWARRTIRKAGRVLIAPYQQTSLKRICREKNLFFLPHCFSPTNFTELLEAKEKHRQTVLAGTVFKHYFFSSTRHLWQGLPKDKVHNKGNQVILRAFKRFLELSAGRDTALILIEKGPDVAASQVLCRQLGIDPQVIWCKEMPRSRLAVYYQGARLCFGQFGTPVLAFTALEPLANATPCISFWKANGNDIPGYQVPPPLYNSRDVEEIARFLLNVREDEVFYQKLCRDSWQWIKENCSEEEFAGKFLKIF